MSLDAKVLLIILDGWGISPIKTGNAPLLAKTPTLDYVYANFPKTAIAASGLEVGLNRGEMGNSEVGHLNLGTGRVVWESLPRIDSAIESGDFGENENLKKFFEKAKQKIHLVSLVSSGGVHSHIRHLVAVLEEAKKHHQKDVYIHFISDGRDTAPEAALGFAQELEKDISDIGVGKIATLIGRYYAMDRDKRWERTEKAYNLLVKGEGKKSANITEAIRENYKEKKSDEFFEPYILNENGLICEGDSVFFLNFRADRMRQISSAFHTKYFDGFPVTDLKLDILAMTEYDKMVELPVVFTPINLSDTLADLLEKENIAQCHIAETEKYPHVTYFFNGGREKPHKGEEQVMVPSPHVATYDLKPQMSAYEVSEAVVKAVSVSVPFIVVNFANGDMVGHTGDLKATITACETVDECLGKVLEQAYAEKYKVIITADHGNCEMMVDPATGDVDKEHTTNPVPLVFLDFANKNYNIVEGQSYSEEENMMYFSATPAGVLSDVAPSVLSLLGLVKPGQMNGSDLINNI